jgi:hypothetical protein
MLWDVFERQQGPATPHERLHERPTLLDKFR